MNIINYVTSLVIPLFILLTIIVGLKEKVPIFEIFISGCKEGMTIVKNIFPNLIALFLAINILNQSGLLLFISNIINPLTSLIHIPKEILPLAILRPISGSGSMALLQQNLENFGVDSYLGKVSSTIMGAAETTFFTIAIYSSVTNIKISNKLIIPAILADICVVISSVYIFLIF